MSRLRQSSIKGLGQNALKLNLLVVLVLFCIASSNASECPAGNVITCKCDNGQIERHYTTSSFKEAREDPSSCCYVRPKDNIKNSEIVYNEEPKKEYVIETEPIEEPENITPDNDEPKQYVLEEQYYEVETKENDDEEKRTEKAPSPIKVLFASVARLHPLIQFHISSFLYA